MRKGFDDLGLLGAYEVGKKNKTKYEFFSTALIESVRWKGVDGLALLGRPYATSLCGLKLLVYAALSDYCMRP